MTTSGAFIDLDIAQIVEEAYERGQGMDVQQLNAGHSRTARRSIQMIFLEWESRGIKVWAIDETVFTVVLGSATLTMPANSVDVLDGYIRRAGSDVVMSKIAREDYEALPLKSNPGKPDRYWTNRASEPFVVTLYPVPDNSTDEIHLWRIRRLYDVTAMQETPDVPSRWISALTARLALALFMKMPLEKRQPKDFQMLKAESDEAYHYAATEDRDRAPTSVIPADWSR